MAWMRAWADLKSDHQCAGRGLCARHSVLRVVTEDVQCGGDIFTKRWYEKCSLYVSIVYLCDYFINSYWSGLFRVFAMHQRLWITTNMMSFVVNASRLSV